MLTHEQVWASIEALARQKGLTVSGLARKAGLDPTTFNRSKRVGNDGRLRWPSTESLAKVLDATSFSLDDFLRLLRDQNILADAASAGLSEPRRPSYEAAPLRDISASWTWDIAPGRNDSKLRALEVTGEGLLPVYRNGAVLLASGAAEIGPGDRVVIETRLGVLVVREVFERNRRGMLLRGWTQGEPELALAAKDIAWTAKILWASQ